MGELRRNPRAGEISVLDLQTTFRIPEDTVENRYGTVDVDQRRFSRSLVSEERAVRRKNVSGAVEHSSAILRGISPKGAIRYRNAEVCLLDGIVVRAIVHPAAVPGSVLQKSATRHNRPGVALIKHPTSILHAFVLFEYTILEGRTAARVIQSSTRGRPPGIGPGFVPGKDAPVEVRIAGIALYIPPPISSATFLEKLHRIRVGLLLVLKTPPPR